MVSLKIKTEKELRKKFKNNLEKIGVLYPTGKQLLALICLYENFKKPV